jgi:hypothetical protein
LADIPVSASLRSYQDEAHSILKDDFLQHQRTFWIAEASSSAATIVEVSLNHVHSGATLLFAPPNTDVDFAATNFLRVDGAVAGVSDHPTESHFAFTLNPDVFFVDTDLSAVFTIGVTLNVVFLNTDAAGAPITRTFSFNPLVMAGAETSNSEVSAASDVTIGGPVSVKKNSLSSSSTAAVIGGAVGGVAFLLVLAAIVVVYRRRVAQKAAPSTTAVALEGVIAEGSAQQHL